jgi:hypothetical protein
MMGIAQASNQEPYATMLFGGGPGRARSDTEFGQWSQLDPRSDPRRADVSAMRTSDALRRDLRR